MEAVIISGGKIIEDSLIKQLGKHKKDLLICADSGANILYNNNIIPDVLIGDFDSISIEAYKAFEKKAVKILKYPEHKDLTDTHIALNYAIQNKAEKITIFGATGTRLDHTLANIFLLEEYMDRVECTLIDDNNIITIKKAGTHKIYANQEFKYISLIPLSDQAKGVTTKGFKYPLHEACLKRADSFGISNELSQKQGEIVFESGCIAVIYSRD